MFVPRGRECTLSRFERDSIGVLRHLRVKATRGYCPPILPFFERSRMERRIVREEWYIGRL